MQLPADSQTMRAALSAFLVVLFTTFADPVAAVPVRAMHSDPAPDASTNWERLVGQPVEAAIAAIKSDRPDLRTVVAVAQDAMVTMDHRMDRVRVFHDADGAVARAPRAG